MMEWFRKRVIGGVSGNRETALFVFLVVTAIAITVMVQEALGRPMPQAYALLTIVWPAALAGVLGAHAFKHAAPGGLKRPGPLE